MKYTIFSIILLVVLAACTPEADNSSNQPANDTNTDTTTTTSDDTSADTVVENLVIPDDVSAPTSEGVEATVTGVLEGDVSAFTGTDECDTGVVKYSTVFNSLAQEGLEGSWRFYMPQNLEPGIYALGAFGERFNDNVVVMSGSLNDKANDDVSYNRVRGGTVEILEAGETYNGRFIAAIGSDDIDGLANVAGNFMFDSDACAGA